MNEWIAWTVSKHWSNVVSAFVMFFLLVVESVDKKSNWHIISHIWRCDVVSSCLSWLRYESVLLCVCVASSCLVLCFDLIWFDLMSCPAECNFSVESTTKPWSPDDKLCGLTQENVETTFAVKIENTSNRFFIGIVYLTFWQISKFNVQNETASPSVDFVSFCWLFFPTDKDFNSTVLSILLNARDIFAMLVLFSVYVGKSLLILPVIVLVMFFAVVCWFAVFWHWLF